MSAKPLLTIYLSSKFADMTAYRKAIEGVLKIGEYADTIKLLYAENAINEDISGWKKVAIDVISCDHYFLLMSERYGSICKDPQVNPNGISFTEHEFITAKNNNKPIRVFAGTDPDLMNFKDVLEDGTDIDKKRKLENFKAVLALEDRYGPKPFATLNELLKQIQAVVFSLFIRRLPPGNENYIYTFCNRLYQTTVFNNNQLTTGGFKAFIVRGEDADLGNELIKRFCLRKLLVTDHKFWKQELVLTEKTNEGNAKSLLNWKKQLRCPLFANLPCGYN